MGLRFEAWTLPTESTFERVIADLPVVRAKGKKVWNDQGDGSLVLPYGYERLTDLIDTDEYGRLIRVYDGSTLIHEWIAERNKIQIRPTGRVSVSGPDIMALLAKSVVYPYDYDGTTYITAHPDHIWGSHRNLLHNGDFEVGDNAVRNGDFEMGAVAPFWAGAVDGVDATIAISNSNPHAGTWHATVTPLVDEGGMSQRVAGLFPEKTYTISAELDGTSGDDLQLGFSSQFQNMGVGTADRLLAFTGSFEGTYEVQKDDTADGTYRTVSFTFDTAPEQTSGQINVRTLEASPNAFDADDLSITGYGVGMQGWQPTDVDSVTKFEATTTAKRSGAYGGEVTASDAAGIVQEVTSVSNGVTYSADVYLKAASGTPRWVLEITDEFGQRIDQDYATLGTGGFTQLQVTGELPDDLPGPRELIVTIRNDSGGSSTVYADDARAYEGEPEATPGDIVTDLHDDASSDHSSDARGAVLDWVALSFDASNDTGSTAWSSNIKFIARASDTFLQAALKNLRRLGYEASLTAKASPSGGVTHDLNLYEPFGLGTDYTSSATPAINIGAGMRNAQVALRIPNFTSVIVFGGDGAYQETQDTTMGVDFGLWEKAVRFSGSDDPDTIDDYAQELIDAIEDELISAKVGMFASSDHPRPGVDFDVGDRLKWQLPPHLPRTDLRVQSFTYQHNEPTFYEVEGVGYTEPVCGC